MVDNVHPPSSEDTPFDEFAQNYEAVLQKGLDLAGENYTFFARGRILGLTRLLQRLREQPRVVLDFACGTGNSTPFFLDILGAESVIGLDLSQASLQKARCLWKGQPALFFHPDERELHAEIDLAFCNGAFHHIPPVERPQVLATIERAIKPGGFFALWENNPWNPGTRLIMHRVEFDRDAIMLSCWEAQRLLRQAGFQVLRTDFFFIFPHALRFLRPLERWVCRLPFGGQYQVLCRKPRS